MPNYRHGPGIDLQMGLRYYQRVLKTARPNLVAYWALGETASFTALDESGNGCNGTMNPAAGAVALAQPGIGDERTSILFNAAGYCNVAGADLTAFNSKFNGQELTISMWRKANGLGIAGVSIYIVVNGNNVLYLSREATNIINAVYTAAGVGKNIAYAPANIQVFSHAVMTISKIADQFKLFVNGTQVGTTQTGLGAWSGTPTRAIIGAINTIGTSPYIGWIQHVAIWNSILQPGQIASLAR